MRSPGRLIVVLLVLAGLLFASPPYVYAHLADDLEPNGEFLGARPLGESQEGRPVDGTKDLLQTWERRYVLDVGRYEAIASTGRTDRLHCNRAANGTVALMRRATAEGIARTADSEVGADVRCMADEFDYYRPTDDGRQDYRAFTVETTDGTTTVESRAISDSELAESIRDGELVRFGDLDAAERRTVHRVIRNSSDPHGTYLPPSDDPVLERAPLLVDVDGTPYVVEVVGHVDEPSAVRLYAFRGLPALGALCVLGAILARVVTLSRRGDGRSDRWPRR